MISKNLNDKIFSAMVVIKEFYIMNNGKIHVSFSGGADSTVLLDIARKCYPGLKAVHLDTMQEYKGVTENVKKYENVVIIRPSMTFTQVVRQYGYPLVSKKIARCIYDIQHASEKNKRTRELSLQKTFIGRDGKEKRNTYYLSEKHRYLLNENIPITHKCCLITKEKPLIQYRTKHKEGALIGMLEDESVERKRALKGSCINRKKNTANPFKGWTKNDVLEYIYTFKLDIPKEYGTVKYDDKNNKFYTTGLERTGCKGCLFGANKEQAIERMNILKDTDIKSYNAFMDGGRYNSDTGMLEPFNGFGYRKIIEKLK